MFLKLANIEGHVEEPTTGEKTFKTVYVVFFAGERARNKMSKICEEFEMRTGTRFRKTSRDRDKCTRSVREG